MRVVFLGTPIFAVPALNAINSIHEVVGVVCPLDKRGDREKIAFCAVKDYAISNNLKLFQYSNVSKEGIGDLLALNADIAVTCSFGQLLSEEFINMFEYGVINIHASLLPKLRGASPIQHALMLGMKESGITIMKTVKKLDAGDILIKARVEITPEMNYKSLSEHLSLAASELIIDALKSIAEGSAEYFAQDEAQSTYCSKLRREDELINFSDNAVTINNKIRALSPSPCAYTFLNGLPLKIHKAHVVDFNASDAAAGEIVFCEKGGLICKCGNGFLSLSEVQQAGKKAMGYRDFVNGGKIKKGDILSNS